MAIDRLVPGGLIKRSDDSFFGSIERHFIYDLYREMDRPRQQIYRWQHKGIGYHLEVLRAENECITKKNRKLATRFVFPQERERE